MARKLLLSAVLVALLAALAIMLRPLLVDSSIWPPDDYVEYWAAGRLNLEGRNPYSPTELLPLERAAGRDTDEAVMMWNPPWTLAAAMPLGALPARLGQFAWLLLNAGCVVGAALMLWNIYGGNPAKRWMPVALALGFAPTLFLLQSGQIGGLLLFGAAAFLWAAAREYGFLAGAAAVLLAIKPHLAYLLWPAVALDALMNRRWRVLIGGVVVGLAAALLPLLFNPDVWSQFFGAYRDHPPAQWISLTLGSVLRLAFGEEKFWLQFVPVAFGLGWFALRWKRYRHDWNWAEQAPALLLVSFVTSPYGAWHFDLVLLLVPLLRRATALVARHDKVRWQWLAVFVVANLGMLAINRSGAYSYWFGWVAPAVLLADPFLTRPRIRINRRRLAPVPA